MKCPIDGTALVIADRSGVEIDYCPQCRGVWLDRGELDKIIDRAGSYAAAPPPPPQQPPQQAPQHAPQHARSEYRQDPRGAMQQGYGDRPRKKKGMGSFIEDIFDF